jgi:hypothetical protein
LKNWDKNAPVFSGFYPILIQTHKRDVIAFTFAAKDITAAVNAAIINFDTFFIGGNFSK